MIPLNDTCRLRESLWTILSRMEDPAEPPIRMADRQRARRSELVKEEVVEAALAEFSERGYHQTSIAHIAERLGTGHSMFYRYFTNKRDILEHVVQHATQRTIETLSHTLPGRITSLNEFHDFSVNLGLAYIDLVVADPRLSRLLLQQGAAVDAEMTAQFCGVFDAGAAVLGGLLRDGIESGYVREDIDVDAVADSVVGIPLGILARYGHEPNQDILAARVRATADLVCRGIAP
ncbi:putative transcriptional regulator, TetR [Mycobacteroides abscessus subsp. abscessus]|nr:putative transcriptional regulator, TetR [Mycobacteroides abscessus subsp. abscessus]SHT44000.1 putative transcriptional regulator, TetR [Mycobacteroides abscessus subsp. abscessus]SHT68989.1 putative transcriptional regulator, TetR [Mycobacteroides abscessus subsp. abscessus]SKE66406.1 putative transcriptional regulator, TetR [Mycobacteroides abscessus subsp. abscessus]SKH65851.1 putative transcriptional regulator, TetR [Mycobacteroides abscessus subsp. abscessus]